MNNRVQQRFDKFTRECLETVRRVTQRESDERARIAIDTKTAKAKKFLPMVVKALESGKIKGVDITREQRKQLKEMRTEYEKLIAQEENAK